MSVLNLLRGRLGVRHSRAPLAAILGRVYGRPLAIEPGVLEAMLSPLESSGWQGVDFAALAADGEQAAFTDKLVPGAQSPRAGAGRAVALIPIHGPLVARGSAWDDVCGFRSYSQIKRDIDQALADPEVGSIVLDIDSPGGEVSGVTQLAEHIRAVSKEKRITAVVNEMAASAAYWLASAASEVVSPKLGMVGSVGVVLRHSEQSKMDKKIGISTTYITYGRKKAHGNPHEPLGDEARSDLQEMVDEAGEEFVSAVAKYRGIKESTVRDTEAGVFRGEKALANGFIDRIGDLNGVLAELLSEPAEEVEVTKEEHAKALAEAVQAERARVSEIASIGARIGASVQAVEQAVKLGLAVEQARAVLFATRSQEQAENDVSTANDGKRDRRDTVSVYGAALARAAEVRNAKSRGN